MFAGFFSWEFYFKDTLMYEEVIVLTTEKAKGEIITAEEVTTKSVQFDSFANAIKNPELVVGKATLVDISPDIPLSEKYFGDQETTVLKDEFVFAIPSDWIYGVPQSLRSSDEIYFYEVKPEQKLDNVTIIEENQIDEIEKLDEYEFVLSTRVMYVKDSGNREVVNVNETREDASGTIDSIEIVVDVEELQTLEAKYRNGSKFIILYRG
jgi:hypothetical protein